MGPNAGGKSNLLDAFRFLQEIVRPVGGGLQAALDARQGFSAIRCLHARRVNTVQFDVDIGNSDVPGLWTYKLSIGKRAGDKTASVLSEEAFRKGERVFERVRGAKDDPRLFSQSRLEQVEQTRDVEELVEFLASSRYLHVVPQIVRDRERAKREGDDPYGGDLLRRMKAMPKKSRDPRLRRISSALAIAVPQFEEITLEDDLSGVPHLVASFKHWRHQVAKQNEAFFSDGTLRLIGLLWSIGERGGPLLLEEPELSLNDAVIAQLPKMFERMQRLSRKQVLATTHSSALLDDAGIGLAEVHRVFVDSNGSHVETLANDLKVRAQVEAGMTISQAVLPLLRPPGIDELGRIDV